MCIFAVRSLVRSFARSLAYSNPSLLCSFSHPFERMAINWWKQANNRDNALKNKWKCGWSSGSAEYKTGINWLNYFSLLKIIVAYPSKVHITTHKPKQNKTKKKEYISFFHHSHSLFFAAIQQQQYKNHLNDKQKETATKNK